MATQKQTIRPQVTIIWLLSEEGRRADLKVGGTGARVQHDQVAAPADVVDLAEITEEGDAVLRVGHVLRKGGVPGGVPLSAKVGACRSLGYNEGYIEFDDVVSWEEAVENEEARRAMLADKTAALSEEMCCEALGALEVFEADESQSSLETGHLRWLDDASKNRYEAVKNRRRQLETAEKVRRFEEDSEAERQRGMASEAKKEAYVFEARAWAKDHGSERLRLIAQSGYMGDSLAVYRDERLALEFPGARWERDFALSPVRNPTLTSLQGLDALSKKDNTARLVFAKWDSGEEYHPEEYTAQAVVVSPTWGQGREAVVVVGAVSVVGEY